MLTCESFISTMAFSVVDLLTCSTVPLADHCAHEVMRLKRPVSDIEPLLEHRNPAGVPSQLPIMGYGFLSS
jgi:hypothetical protein